MYIYVLCPMTWIKDKRESCDHKPDKVIFVVYSQKYEHNTRSGKPNSRRLS